MLKPFLMVSLLFLFGAPAFQQQTPATPAAPAATPAPDATPQGPAPNRAAIPAEYLNMTNPVKPTPASQARAQQIYSWDCAMCHGDNGNGKGEVAADQKLTVPDFRDPNSLKQLTDGQMFYIIHIGEGKMPGEGPRAKTDEVWNLVIYLRKMATSTTAASQPPA